MRFIVADWGTSRFRAYLVEDTTIGRVASDEGVSALKAGEHQAVFRRRCGRWLDAGARCARPARRHGRQPRRMGRGPLRGLPGGPDDVARALIPVDLGEGRRGHVVPGLCASRSPARST